MPRLLTGENRKGRWQVMPFDASARTDWLYCMEAELEGELQ